MVFIQYLNFIKVNLIAQRFSDLCSFGLKHFFVLWNNQNCVFLLNSRINCTMSGVGHVNGIAFVLYRLPYTYTQTQTY